MLLNKFTLFDRSKLIFTVIIGLMFFFYDIGTIQDSDLPTVSPTKDFIHAVPYKP